MKPVQRLFSLLQTCAFGVLLASCATTIPGLEGEAWRQFAAAADTQSTRTGAVSLQFAWEIPKQRLLMLARADETRMALYQIEPKATFKPGQEGGRINCYTQGNELYCAAPGQAAPSLVASPGADLWAAVQAHAANLIPKLNADGRTLLQAQLARQRPGPRIDITRQRHPFEWGGEHETIENAQAFLEAVTAQGTPFRSLWPQTPALGSNWNEWQNENDKVTLKTTGRCLSLASSPSRTAFHTNHDFWAAEGVKFQTIYRWQQPIEWGNIKGTEADKDGVFMHGRYTGSFQGQGLAYVSGWSPDILTANATRFDPAKYSVAAWNLHLLLPATNGMRERVHYAVTYLNLMCAKG
ncbi:hypothetical protein [Massilia sp. 9I]|uniref:hypothetical protein n=1 Tax=Massilia sp. 9I TaxID=2653152 RepID=UPI0012F42946|nr:hypothetical protein [Massilia sp. 9I]VXC76893.1 conserved exported hypothetical protein [Massilia sp. 9I]